MVLEGEAEALLGHILVLAGAVMRSQLLGLSFPPFIRATRFSLFCEVKGAVVGGEKILEP